uniref:OPR1 n=1 Tax=Arundo donax TaxID=35708 RepID=A0A0A8Z405_ARUDO
MIRWSAREGMGSRCIRRRGRRCRRWRGRTC